MLLSSCETVIRGVRNGAREAKDPVAQEVGMGSHATLSTAAATLPIGVAKAISDRCGPQPKIVQG